VTAGSSPAPPIPAPPIPPPQPPPPLRLPDQPLPPYRFVPGSNPHPLRHPAGHSFTPPAEGGATRWHQPKIDPDSPEAARVYLRGLDLFDHRYPWEAHEALEEVWAVLPRDDPRRALCQGLIQVAASLLKRHQGHLAGARRLRAKGMDKLRRASAARPGPGLPDLIARLERLEPEEWPLISRGLLTPPDLRWRALRRGA